MSPSFVAASLAPLPFSVKTLTPISFGKKKILCPFCVASVLALPAPAKPRVSDRESDEANEADEPEPLATHRYLPFGGWGSTWTGESRVRCVVPDHLPSSDPEPGGRDRAFLRSPDEVAGDDRRQQKHADDDVLGVTAEVGELHAVPQHGDEDEREEDPEHRARAAEDVHAAEDDRGDDVEQRALRRVGAGRAEEADVDDAGDRRPSAPR